MTALIITNIMLATAIGTTGIALLISIARDSRPIVIKEAKALREYYEEKLKDVKGKADDAERERIRYKELYNNELQRSCDKNDILSEKVRLEAQVKSLTKDLNSCEDRINDMALENAGLKEKIKTLEKTTRKGKKK